MGIGISCHELAHALGLPDFYDANEGQDGYAGGLYDFSLMCRGLYNNEDRTPPYLNALERMLLGWIPEIPELPESGEVLLGPVQQNLAYRIPTQTEGEFFLVESRDGTVWDAPLPEGLQDGQSWYFAPLAFLSSFIWEASAVIRSLLR